MFAKKSYRNISMWGLVLKSLLRGTPWCNWILITILGLGATTFFILKEIASGR
jgi:F0F1-type ATP synthase assembly protein I